MLLLRFDQRQCNLRKFRDSHWRTAHYSRPDLLLSWIWRISRISEAIMDHIHLLKRWVKVFLVYKRKSIYDLFVFELVFRSVAYAFWLDGIKTVSSGQHICFLFSILNCCTIQQEKLYCLLPALIFAVINLFIIVPFLSVLLKVAIGRQDERRGIHFISIFLLMLLGKYFCPIIIHS